MANSYLNIITFLLTTITYYVSFKPLLTYDILSDNSKYIEFISNSYMYLAIYVLFVILIQFIVNSSIITTNCGGNITDNIGVAGVLTFLPWVLIFGILIVVLMIYPGFKSAFSDVVGYYYVSNSANKILTELLINKDVEQATVNDQTISADKKNALETAADTIVKICGNTAILINQIVPSNFEQYWNILKPLMKQKYQSDNNDTTNIRNQLFDIVVTRDNIGEAMWYIYTGLLLTSLVQFKISTHGCVSNPKTMEANYNKFLEQEQSTQSDVQQSSTTYTITS